MVVKTFENFEHDNSKIWIYGIPSGEALQINRENHNELYKKKLIYYTTEYTQIGFFAFHDKNVDEILELIDNKKEPKDIFIYEHKFGKTLIDAVEDIINSYKKYAELYASGNVMGISFSPKNQKTYYLQINKETNNYIAELNLNGKFISRYNILNDDNLLRSIKKEMSRN